ncbi:hypothetical protein [Paraburkholderia bannensis]|uniref:hypothetical protein n=1 Tax=Paraburkholderia bannensis TaxID=765414 RepID=UPI002AB6CEDF|nr:hypothetical protein [Paraburkholderia bannensis]
MSLTLSAAYAQNSTTCVSAQQHAATDARIDALTQNFDVAKISRDLGQAGEDQKAALDAVQECQKNSLMGMGCSSEIDTYNLADERFKMIAQQVDVYRTMAAAQASARATELPACK